MIKKRWFSRSKVDAKSDGHRYFVRLNFNERVQHMIFLICFIVLAITGFMLKLPEDIVQRFGDARDIVFFYRGILHRIAGTIMILAGLSICCQD